MSNYLTILLDDTFEKFDKDKSYILLFNADQIPPHLGFVCSNRYFSLTFDDCQIDDPVRPILTYFRKGKNKCLAIELTDSFAKKEVEEIFKKYGELKDGKTTCLFPIKEVLKMEDKNEIQFIYHLIPELLDLNMVNRILGINFSKERKNVSIFKYSMKTIQDRIKELNEYGRS